MADIIVNEIFPNPTDGLEWVELLNNSSYAIHTSRLNVYDSTGKKLTLNSQSIEPHTYVTATASAILNNSGDSVILEKDSVIVETIIFPAIESGKSYMRCDNFWVDNINPSYTAANLCEEPTLIVQPSLLHVELSPSPQLSIPIPSTFPSKKLSGSTVYISGTPILFSKKHGLPENKHSKEASPEALVAHMITPPVHRTSANNTSYVLLAIGGFSFIQCVILVYLIYKRITLHIKER